jgi:hypothetical protein
MLWGCQHAPGHPLTLAHVTKNWQPLLLGPAFAADSSPGPVWRAVKFSSVGRRGVI